MSVLEVNKLTPLANNGTVTMGDSGDTISIPSGVTIANAGTATGFGGANTPAFHATMSGDQNLSNDTDTKINFNTEVFDTNNNYNTSNFRFTPTVAGKYFFIFSMLISSGSGIGVVQPKLKKNGSDALITRNAHFYGAAQQSYMISGIISCDGSSDYIEAFGAQNSGSTKPVIATVTSSFFQGYKLIGA